MYLSDEEMLEEPWCEPEESFLVWDGRRKDLAMMEAYHQELAEHHALLAGCYKERRLKTEAGLEMISAYCKFPEQPGITVNAKEE